MEQDNGRPGGLSSCGSSPAVSTVPASIPDAGALCELLGLLAKGYWQASVYHAPPNRQYPRGGIMCGTSITLPGKYPSRDSAERAAKAAIASGRVDIRNFIHGPSARAYARFCLGQEHIEAMAIIAQGIETGTAEPFRLSPKGESPVPQECAPTHSENNQ